MSILIIQTTILFIPPFVAAEPSQKARDGKLDLREQPLQDLGTLELSGEWEFYWNQLVEPGLVQHSSQKVVVPNTWSNYLYDGGKLPQEGYATYRMTILLNEGDIGKVVSFYIPGIATSYNLWVNDRFIKSNGTVGRSRDSTIPGDNPQIATFKVEDTQLELYVQVANFHQRKAGLWETIRFGTWEQISHYHDKKIVLEAFVIGCIFIIGFYHLVMFLLRPKELSLLYLAIACFSITLRTSLLDDKLIQFVTPNLEWEIAVKMEYISALTALIFFALFMKTTLMVNQCERPIHWIIRIILIYIAFIVVFPAYIFTNTYGIFQLFVIAVMLYIIGLTVIGIQRKNKGAISTFVAMLIIFTAVLNDLFYYSNHLSTNELVSVGFLIYLVFQAIDLARKFMSTFANVEKLSEELRVVTASLERKVKKRTTELRHANRNLKKMEQARRRLFASVSHELNTPLTFIQGNVKAMLDGVIPKDDSTNLRAIHNDTKIMARLIQDLQELSKLESGQITFQQENVNIVAVMTAICSEQQSIMFKKGYTFYLENHLAGQVICQIDIVRIKQVVLNLLVNAQKFTKKGGSIIVRLEKSPNHDGFTRVSVTDNGKGISAKNLPNIFDRFYKVDQRVKKGAGLGLAIVKEIVEHHQGTVGVISQKGEGSTFYFTLPTKKE
jgi:signal transduction histidine kinase